MENYQKILPGIIIAIALISGCIIEDKVLTSYPRYSIPDAPLPAEICEKITNIDTKDDCFVRIEEFDRITNPDKRNYHLAIKHNSADFCDEIEEEDVRDGCYVKFHIYDNQEEIKPEVPDDVRYLFSWNDILRNDSEWYSEWFIEEFLIGSRGLSWAENAEVRKSADNKTITITKGEHSVALKLNEEKNTVTLETDDKKTYEYAVREEDGKLNVYDENICETLYRDLGPDKDLCYRKLARAAGNASLCGMMSGGDVLLRDYCYKDAAEMNNDTSICEEVENIDIRERCKHGIKYEDYHETHCEEIAKCMFRDECFWNLARKTNNSLLCEKIDSVEYTGYCYFSFARLLGDEAFCGKINDLKMKDECYFDIAIMSENDVLCGKVRGYDFKLACLGLTRNPGYCSDIGIKDCRLRCLGDVALRWEDPSLCSGKCADVKNQTGCYDDCYLQLAVYLYREGKGERYYFGYLDYRDEYGKNVCYKKGVFDMGAD